jgi:hypothetical protein
MWDDLVAWFQSPDGARVLQTAIIPALAILVAGVLAALIGRAAVRGSIRRADRVEAAAAVAGLVEAARAAAEPDAADDDRRRAARLRTEADVRTRLLPLPHAALAADWAAARTDTLRQRAADGPVGSEVDELRDRLVAWVNRPGRARRILTAAPAPKPTRPAAKADRPSKADRGTTAVTPAEPGPRRSTAEPAPAAAAPAAAASAAAAPAAPAPAPAAPAVEPAPATAVAVHPATEAPTEGAAPREEAVPAWQRTRSGERLQQDHAARARTTDAPVDGADEDEAGRTAPVQLQHAHRADGAPRGDVDEAVRLEAHEQARHARPDEPAPATGDVPQTGPRTGAAARVPAPAWLDDYDDEAQITQNLDLKTPPPVAASSVRGRGTPGEDLVPRS